jgi:hypothetical protein
MLFALLLLPPLVASALSVAVRRSQARVANVAARRVARRERGLAARS